MRTWLLVLPVVVAACTDDPTLEVSVTHPTGFSIASTTVSVYESDSVSCDQIEFGDLSDEVLQPALVSEADVGALTTSGALTNISRTQTKAIVARGLDAAGNVITAGCIEQGEVVGHLTVDIVTVPTATVLVVLNSDRSGISVTTTDALNSAIENRQVKWRVFGAAGTTADPAKYHVISDGVWEQLEPTCTISGEATIHPMPPAKVSAFALDVRVSWAAQPIPLLTSFTPFPLATAQIATDPLVAPSSIVRHCAVRRGASSAGVVCLTSATSATEYRLVSGALAPQSPQSVSDATDPAVVVVSVPTASNGLDVYAITQAGNWIALSGAATPGAQTSPLCLGTPPCLVKLQDARVLPACGGTGALVLQTNQLDNKRFRFMALLGGPTSNVASTSTAFNILTATINNAGCVTELQAGASSIGRQTIVLDNVKVTAADGSRVAISAAVFPCSLTSGSCAVALPGTGGVGFTTGPEPALIGGSIDASGSQINTWVFGPANNKDHLVERTRQDAAAPPETIVTGRFDMDDSPDLMWGFTTHPDSKIQMAYAREVNAVPLSAIQSLQNQIDAAPQQLEDLLTGDLNGDGFDDVIAVVRSTVGQTTTSLGVVPAFVPFAVGNLPDETACH